MLKKIGYLLKFFSKLISADSTVIKGMIENSCKDLISSITCVGALQLLNLVAIFDLYKICTIRLINYLKKIRNNNKLCERVKTVQQFASFLDVFRTLSDFTSTCWQQFHFSFKQLKLDSYNGVCRNL